jgi:hypothetical protein
VTKAALTFPANLYSIWEYVRGDAHANIIEEYLMKRGYWPYHRISPQHLKRYLAEFDFRYNERAAVRVEDEARADHLLRGIVAKRLRTLSPASIGDRNS